MSILDPSRNALAKIDTPALVSAGIGGSLVLLAYVIVFRNEKESYVKSRFWVGINESTATALIPLQLAAAIGYIVFILYASGVADKRPQRGILTYLNGYSLTLSIWVFSIASILWPFSTQWYLDGSQTLHRALLPASSLILAAVAAIVMTAGAFEADLRWPAILGIIAFSSVVVMADAVGW